MIYKSVIRPLLFSLDPEHAHDLFLKCGPLFNSPAFTRALSRLCTVRDERLVVKAFGLEFSNPIGLAAGFDKDCRMAPFLCALGFGHIEVGTITALPQPGNDRPRIFRFPEDRALINRMGFPSAGVEAVSQRIGNVRGRLQGAVFGVNLGKSRVVPLDDAIHDYLRTFNSVRSLADYFVLNVSSPNTPELVKLQERPRLEALFRAVQDHNPDRKPLLVKISPDLEKQQLDDVLECCLACGVAGIIATNTTYSRSGLSRETVEKGGLSGAPLRAKSLETIRHLHKQVGGRLTIVGAGGVFTVDDLIETLGAGAALVQIYTGFIYEGPLVVKRLLTGLLRRMQQLGVTNLSELVGSAVTR